jgi:hypothetical protein
LKNGRKKLAESRTAEVANILRTIEGRRRTVHGARLLFVACRKAGRRRISIAWRRALKNERR